MRGGARGSARNQTKQEPAGTRPAGVTPLVRALAVEHGVDLASVEGTGVGGRIKKADVLAAAGIEPTTLPAPRASAGIPLDPAASVRASSAYRGVPGWNTPKAAATPSPAPRDTATLTRQGGDRAASVRASAAYRNWDPGPQ